MEKRRRSDRRLGASLLFQLGLLALLAALSLMLGAASQVTVPILVHVRLPRLAGCLLAGSGLAAAGMILQTVLANPLASPNLLGIQSGAGLMVVLAAALLPALTMAPTASRVMSPRQRYSPGLTSRISSSVTIPLRRVSSCR